MVMESRKKERATTKEKKKQTGLSFRRRGASVGDRSVIVALRNFQFFFFSFFRLFFRLSTLTG
jgi:hypothetical protein